MDALDVSELQVIGGVLMLVALFVLREFASGALKKAGEEFWLWVRRGRSGRQAAGTEASDSEGTGDHAVVDRRRGEHVERGGDDDRLLCLLVLNRSEARAAATQQDSRRDDDLSDSHRKSA
jgi:hypothetical protein